jgi:hypothetical protein
MTDNKLDPALTGAEYELANAGYALMPDSKRSGEDEPIAGDSASLREAAARRSGARENVVVRRYLDRDGEPVPANEAITLERAGRDYAGVTAADKLAAESRTSATLAAHVDALRAEALARDPDAAEFYGFEPPQTKADKSDGEKADFLKAESEPAATNGDQIAAKLDPELEKALQHPQVRQAIEEQVGEVEKVRQNYLSGLAAATQIAQVSFISQFPELASVAPEQLPAALAQMSRQDPARFARVQAMIATTDQLMAQRQHEDRRQADMARQNFHRYATSEDARFEAMLKGESKATQHAVTTEIFSSARASGVEAAELVGLFNSEPLMRNAVFQRMMYDAGKYRLMMKAKDAAATRPVPPVQRPGSARTPAEREHADLRTLTTKLSNSGDIKDAVALYNARKSARR